MMRFFLPLFFIFLLSCSAPSGREVHNLSLFFDINTYLDRYLDSIPETLTVRKTVRSGDLTEVKELDQYNIRVDLDFFRKGDLYDPVFADKYDIDSSVSGVTKYLSNGSDLFVQRFELFSAGDRIDSIRITTQLKSMISKQVNHLVFDPSGSYSIFTEEDAVFKSPVERMIRVDFR